MGSGKRCAESCDSGESSEESCIKSSEPREESCIIEPSEPREDNCVEPSERS